MSSDPVVEARKKMLRNYYEKIVDKLGYKFTPDTALVEFLLEAEVKLEQKHGSPFCPCQARTGEREHDMKIVCPCIPFHRKHYDAMKRCWCGLFVHKDVTNPDELLQIPANEVK
jgi:ferredoxin-thioredoxin reductase catalytic chain